MAIRRLLLLLLLLLMMMMRNAGRMRRMAGWTETG